MTVRIDAALTASPDISNIETINLTRVTADVDLTGTDLSDVVTLQVDDARTSVAISADTMPDTISITNTFAGGTTAAITTAFTFDDPTNENLNLNLSKAGVLNKSGENYNIAVVGVDNGGDITDLEVVVTGSNYVTMDSTGSLATIETLTVKGTGDLYLVENGSTFDAITTIDASALVGGLQLTGDAVTALAYNDFSDFDTSTELEVVKGGSGNNRIAVGVVTTDTVYTMQGGADAIDAGAAEGDDTYNTGAGNDTVTASSGDITADLGAGNDTIRIGSGELDDNDSIAGGDGADTLRIDLDDAAAAATLIDDGVVTGFETIRWDMAVDAAVTLDFEDFADITTFVLGDTDLDDIGDMTINNSDGKVITVSADLDANDLVITSTDRSDSVTVNVTGAALPGLDGNADAAISVTDVDTVALNVTATASYAAANLAGNARIDQVAAADLSGLVDNAETVTVVMTATAQASTGVDGATATATLDGLTATAVSTLNVTATAKGAADNDANVSMTIAATTVDTVNLTLNASGATGDNVVTADVVLALDTVAELTLTVNDGFGGTDGATGAAISIDAATTTNSEMTLTVKAGGIVESLTVDATSAESVVFSLDLANFLVDSDITLEDTSTITISGDGTIGTLGINISDADTSAATAVIDLTDFTGDFNGGTADGGIVIANTVVASSILLGTMDLASSADGNVELDLSGSTQSDTVSFQADMTGVIEIDGFDAGAEDLLDLAVFNTTFADIVETAYDEDDNGVNDSVLLSSRTGKFDFKIALIGVLPADITAADYAAF